MTTLGIIAWIVLTLVGVGVILSLIAHPIRGTLWTVYLVPWLARMGWAKLTGATPTGHGSAHLARLTEIEAKGLFNAHGIPLGTYQERTLREPFGGHVALIGPPRSKKSWGLMMPAIEQYLGSVLVNDVRGELYDHTATTRRLKGTVYRVHLTNKESVAVNVLDLVRWGHDEQYGDVQRLAHGLLSPDPGEPWDAWSLEAEPLLVALIFDRQRQGEGSLPAVVRWMTSPSQSRGDKLKQLLRSPIPTVQAGARRLLDNSDRQQGVVWGRLLSALNIYQDPVIAANTDHSDISLTELQDGTRPVSVYLITPFGDAARLRPLHASLIEMIIARVSQPHAETPRHRLLLCLDEAMNLGRMDELERGMSYLEGAHTQILLVGQNVQQFRHVYGERSPLLASIATSVYYTPTPGDTATASYLSQRLGTATAVRTTETQTVSLWGFLQRKTFGEDQHARPLMTPDEIARLGDDEAIVLAKGCAPISARKLGSIPAPILNTRQLVGVNAALIAIGLLVGWWLLQNPTPVASMTPPPVTMTPMPSRPDTPAPPPGRGNGRLGMREWMARVERPGWAVVSVEHGVGWGASPGSPLFPESRHRTWEDCEAAKVARIAQLHQRLAEQMSAIPGLSATPTGLHQDLGNVRGIHSWKQTIVICTVWIDSDT